MEELNLRLSTMRSGNAKRIAQWAIDGGATFSSKSVSIEFGLTEKQAMTAIENIRRRGFVLSTKFVSSGEWGKAHAVYKITGVCEPVDYRKRNSAKKDLWRLALSI